MYIKGCNLSCSCFCCNVHAYPFDNVFNTGLTYSLRLYKQDGSVLTNGCIEPLVW